MSKIATTLNCYVDVEGDDTPWAWNLLEAGGWTYPKFVLDTQMPWSFGLDVAVNIFYPILRWRLVFDRLV